MQSYELPTTDNWRLATGNCFLSSVNWPIAPNFIVNKYLHVDVALYYRRDTFTNVMSALQIQLFMQNKAKFQKVKLSVTIEMKKDYDQMDTWSIRKNKPKTNPIQSQYKPNTNPILQYRLPPKINFSGTPNK